MIALSIAAGERRDRSTTPAVGASGVSDSAVNLREFSPVSDLEANLEPFSKLRWSVDGLIPAIIQDADGGDVLMMAWMDRAALVRTLETGLTHFYSRSRRSSWKKGETSGHVQRVESIRIDCDGDVLLVKARQTGGACHEGYRSCFFRELDPSGRLSVVAERVFVPETVYSAKDANSGE